MATRERVMRHLRPSILRIMKPGTPAYEILSRSYKSGNKGPPFNIEPPVLSFALWGRGLSPTLDEGVWGGDDGVATYTIKRAGVAIAGAEDLTAAEVEDYELVAADIGPELSVVRIVTNSYGSSEESESAAVQWTPGVESLGRHWYRADEATLTSGKPSSWTDLIGNDPLLQTVAGDRPTVTTLGGQTAFDFTASAEWLTATLSASISQPWSIFVVYKADSTSGTRLLTWQTAAHQIYLDGGDLNAFAGAELDGPVPTLGSQALYFSANGSTGAFFVDDFSLPTSIGSSGANAMGALTVGASTAGANPWDGKVAEIVVFASALDVRIMWLCSCYAEYRYSDLSLTIATDPIPLVAPTLSVATWGIGNTISVDDGTWAGTATDTYTLKRDGVAVGGATGLTLSQINAYALVAADIGPSLTVDRILTGAHDVVTTGSNALAWTPAEDPNLVHWYRAGDTTVVSGKISAFTDLEGTDHLAQATEADRLTLVTRLGQSAAQGVSNDSAFGAFTNGGAISQPFTVFFLFEPSNLTGAHVMYDGDDVTNRAFMFTNGTDLQVGSQTTRSIGTIALDTVYATCAVYNGASGKFYINDFATPVTPSSTGTSGIDGFTLGDRYNFGAGLTGYLWNAIIRTGDPSSTIRALYGAYHNYRYGLSITLP